MSDHLLQEQFEHCVLQLYTHADIRKRKDGCYINDQIQSAWWGWKRRGTLIGSNISKTDTDIS